MCRTHSVSGSNYIYVKLTTGNKRNETKWKKGSKSKGKKKIVALRNQSLIFWAGWLAPSTVYDANMVIDWCSEWNGNAIINSGHTTSMLFAARHLYGWFRMQNNGNAMRCEHIEMRFYFFFRFFMHSMRNDKNFIASGARDAQAPNTWSPAHRWCEINIRKPRFFRSPRKILIFKRTIVYDISWIDQTSMTSIGAYVVNMWTLTAHVV